MNKWLFVISLAALLLVFGCVESTDQGTKNETILNPTQGIDIINGRTFVSEMSPGGVGTISFTVRDNLGGVTAKDIIVGLDNLGVFKILDCGKDNDPSDSRSCSGLYPYDPYLPVSQHGTPKMYPGQEITFRWRLRAPSSNEIGYISLKHPLYYYLEYTYYTTSAQSIAFMSQQEYERRQQTGNSLDVSGKLKLSAGEIIVNLYTQQPIVFYYTYPDSNEEEPPYDFTLVFKVKNEGKGLPLSDVLIITQIPKGINVTRNTLNEGWMKITDKSCKVTHVLYQENNEIKEGTMSCGDWAKYVFGEDVFNKMDKDRTYAYVIGYTEIPEKGRVVPMDLQITSSEMTRMKQTNTPIKFFTLQSYVVYRYYKEGETYINVYPLRI